jgi:hypothetical protein
LVIGGRIVTSAHYRTTEFPDLADTVAWWTAATVFGALIAAAGAGTFLGWGTLLAVVGVVLFLAAAVAVGAGRFELSSAMAGSGFLWTTAGIGVSVGTLANEGWVPAGFLVVGSFLAGFGARRGILASRRSGSSTDPTPLEVPPRG